MKFFADNKLIIIGFFMTISEIIVILVNTYKKIISMKEVKSLNLENKTMTNHVLWIINPLNIFKKPN
jgi:hypothetical protein